jgi:hypothetical protein
MSSELERRLEGLLAAGPEPEPGAGEEALHRALSALRTDAPPRRALRTAVLAFAAAVVLLAIAAGSLAAAGALHVSFGARHKQRPATTTQLSLPRGAHGIAAIVDGRLSVVIKHGFRLQGQAATAVALSPHALYIAAGIGKSLVAMAPNGRQAWSHAAGGEVVAVAWAPDGLEIAYIVRAGRHLALHVIYGNGKADTAIDRSVRAVRPSWRADSLALAYVGAGGRAVVYDLSHQTRGLVPVNAPATGVAFPPRGHSLAVATPTGVWLAHGREANTETTGSVEAFGWLNGGLAVAVPGRDSARMHLFTDAGTPRGSYSVHGIVVAVTPRLVLVRTPVSLVAGHSPLLSVQRRTSVRDLQVG